MSYYIYVEKPRHDKVSEVQFSGNYSEILKNLPCGSPLNWKGRSKKWISKVQKSLTYLELNKNEFLIYENNVNSKIKAFNKKYGTEISYVPVVDNCLRALSRADEILQANPNGKIKIKP